MRRLILIQHEQGKTRVEIAKLAGYTRSYVSTLLKRLRGAPEMLESMPRGGRTQGSFRALSAKAGRRTQQLICGKCAYQLSLPFALWTRGAIRELVRRELGIRLSIRGVGDYVARWGYPPQKAARCAYKLNDAAAKGLLSIEYPKITARAKNGNAEIGCADETGVRSDETCHRGYEPPGRTPIVRIPVRRKSLPMIAAATNQCRVRFMIYPGGLSPERLIVFMQRLIKDARRKVFLIHGNLNMRKAGMVREWVGDHFDRIEVVYFPRYSPELNPTE